MRIVKEFEYKGYKCEVGESCIDDVWLGYVHCSQEELNYTKEIEKCQSISYAQFDKEKNTHKIGVDRTFDVWEVCSMAMCEKECKKIIDKIIRLNAEKEIRKDLNYLKGWQEGDNITITAYFVSVVESLETNLEDIGVEINE